jgi:hypothetical protein
MFDPYIDKGTFIGVLVTFHTLILYCTVLTFFL